MISVMGGCIRVEVVFLFLSQPLLSLGAKVFVLFLLVFQGVSEVPVLLEQKLVVVGVGVEGVVWGLLLEVVSDLREIFHHIIEHLLQLLLQLG